MVIVIVGCVQVTTVIPKFRWFTWERDADISWNYSVTYGLHGSHHLFCIQLHTLRKRRGTWCSINSDAISDDNNINNKNNNNKSNDSIIMMVMEKLLVS